MTAVDRIIPFYIWFTLGFGVVAVILGIINFCVNIITMLTVKQIYIPLWAVVLLSLFTVIFCVFVGWFFEYYKIWDRMTSHTNRKMNPEIRSIVSDIQKIKVALQIKE